jgi:hypothetical protein
MPRLWKNEADLAELILRQVRSERRVVLTPNTAHFVALKLRDASKKPTIAEVIGMICERKCPTPCNQCQGKANVIVRAYGFSLPT